MPHESKSSLREIQNYLGRISGPLLDRIDLHIEVPAVKFREITSERTGETSAQIRERVITARQRQLLKMAMSDYNFSARAFDRILKVGRTIADLAGADAMNSDHVSEAIQFRSLDRQLWT